MAHDGEKELAHDVRFIGLVLKFEPITTKALPPAQPLSHYNQITPKTERSRGLSQGAYQHQLLVRASWPVTTVAIGMQVQSVRPRDEKALS